MTFRRRDVWPVAHWNLQEKNAIPNVVTSCQLTTVFLSVITIWRTPWITVWHMHSMFVIPTNLFMILHLYIQWVHYSEWYFLCPFCHGRRFRMTLILIHNPVWGIADIIITILVVLGYFKSSIIYVVKIVC